MATEDGSWPSARFEGALADPGKLWDEVRQELLSGKGLSRIGRDRGFPVLRFCAWVSEDAERAKEYEALMRLTAQVHVSEAVEIADTVQVGTRTKTKVDADGGETVETLEADMIEHRRLQIDTRLRVAEKIDPGRWGARTQIVPMAEGGFDGALDGLAAALLDRMRVVSVSKPEIEAEDAQVVEAVRQPIERPEHGLI